MPDASFPANRLLALEQALAQRQLASGLTHSPLDAAIPPAQGAPTNRLLALEQSLQSASQTRNPWDDTHTWQRLATSLQLSRQQGQTRQSNESENGNGKGHGHAHHGLNRWLALEQSLNAKSAQNGSFSSPDPGHRPQNSARSLSAEPPPRRSRIIAQAFDLGESIHLQYTPTAFSQAAEAAPPVPTSTLSPVVPPVVPPVAPPPPTATPVPPPPTTPPHHPPPAHTPTQPHTTTIRHSL